MANKTNKVDSQRLFKVFQFCETLESCVLPTDWVNKKGEVKYDSKKASDYIKNGKQPYKKWPTYKVRPLCEKVFDSYNRAYQAEKILLEKSDLDSSDVENLYNPSLILNKKRQRRPVLKPGDVAHNSNSEIHISSTSDNSNESSDDDDRSSKCDIENPPPVPSAFINENHKTGFIDENLTHDGELILEPCSSSKIIQCESSIQHNISNGLQTDHNIFHLNEPTIQMNACENNNSPVPIEQQIVVHENVALTIATTADIKELKTIILKQNTLIENQNNKIDQLMAMVLELHKRGKKRGHVEDFCQKNNDLNLTFSYPDLMLPLGTIDSIEKLEEILKDDVVANHFRSFLLQLGGHNLKVVIKHIIRRVYSLQLQGKVNYTGREGKCGMSRLQQTKIIIEVMQRNTGKTEAEAIDEYMYHMQHVSDRVRSSERMARTANI